MNFSERPETASNGGDMGFVPESQLHSDPAVFAAVSKLKAGEITDVLPILDAQTRKPAGYAIYKLHLARARWSARHQRSAGAADHPPGTARCAGRSC